MAKRQNYGFQKHQKELKKQAKRQEKEDKKRLRAEPAESAVPPEPGPSKGS